MLKITSTQQPAPSNQKPVTSIQLTLFTLFTLFTCSCTKSPEPLNPYGHHWQTFVMGADLSYVNQILDKGGVYRDSGKIMDPYEIFRNHGCNLVRLRLWHNPTWTKEIYGDDGTQLYNDFEDVKRAIARAKSLGMAVNLDFHYSDTWADPHRQEIPAAWHGLSPENLEDSVYLYTRSVLSRLDAAGMMPEMVQIGNEINPGMLHPTGSNALGWTSLGRLLNAGIRAVREVSDGSEVKTKIILHVAQPENVRFWFKNAMEKGEVTDFDVLGFSYYSKWSEVSLSQIENFVREFKEDFGKEVMVVETAYPWTSEGADQYGNIISGEDIESGYPATVEGQQHYLTDLVNAIYKGGGKGIMVWEPAWISSPARDLWGNGSAWENCTFFDFSGNTLPSINFLSTQLVK